MLLIFYSKLISCLGTFFSIKSEEMNGRINFFFIIILMNFLFLPNLFADFFKFFKCRRFNKILIFIVLGKSSEENCTDICSKEYEHCYQVVAS